MGVVPLSKRPGGLPCLFQPSMNQDFDSQMLTLLTPWFWTSQPPELWGKKKNSVVYKTPKLWYFFVIAAWTKTNMTAYVQNDYSISSLHLLNLLSKDSSSLLLILPHTIVTLIKKKKSMRQKLIFWSPNLPMYLHLYTYTGHLSSHSYTFYVHVSKPTFLHISWTLSPHFLKDNTPKIYILSQILYFLPLYWIILPLA